MDFFPPPPPPSPLPDGIGGRSVGGFPSPYSQLLSRPSSTSSRQQPWTGTSYNNNNGGTNNHSHQNSNNNKSSPPLSPPLAVLLEDEREQDEEEEMEEMEDVYDDVEEEKELEEVKEEDESEDEEGCDDREENVEECAQMQSGGKNEEDKRKNDEHDEYDDVEQKKMQMNLKKDEEEETTLALGQNGGLLTTEQQQKMAEEQALRLLRLCDPDSKGFVLHSDLDRLLPLTSGQQFAQLERAFALADRRRVNLVYERDFLAVIEPLLLNQLSGKQSASSMDKMASSNGGMSPEFQAISLDYESSSTRRNSLEEWSPPSQKLTIAIDSGRGGGASGGGGGLATVRSNEFLSIGYLGGLSPATSSGGGLRTGSHSPSSHSAISLHDELMLNKIESAVNCLPTERSNGLPAQVLLREMQSPGSTCSEPLPMRDYGDFFGRRTTCGNQPARKMPLDRQYSMDQDANCPERIFKVVFVGDSAVGKTCFLHRYCHNRFKPLFSATIGVDFTVKTLAVRNRLVALQLWDTAGQERFRSITKQYFRKADGVVLMYDVTSETSFINVRNWIESVRVGVDDGCVLCLVGNKVDLYPNEHCRTITYKHGKDLAEEFDMLFFETSAFSGQGIEECMQALALRLQLREDEHMDELINLEAMMTGGNRNWCCI